MAVSPKTKRASELVDLTVDKAVLDAYDGPIPQHIAVIMDGNGRWATSRGMPRIRGHHEGANAVRRAVESCRYLGVDVLTLYAFSSQNWSRPQDEVSGLMTLFDIYIKRERKRLMKNNVGLRVIGDRSKLSPKLQHAIEELEAATAPGAKMTLQVAVSYGGREEIVQAARKIAAQAIEGKVSVDQIDTELFSKNLYTSEQPDPDLMIRTSGELRISNFLLWQLAYSEIFVSDVFWPAFDEAALVEALRSYGQRERRFGLTSAQVQGDSPASEDAD